MHLGIKIALGGLLAGRKSGPEVLANMSVPSISTAVIGGSSVLSFGTWQGAASLAGELLRDGVVVATGLTDGQAMTWLAGDDLANMELRVTATGADGMQLLQVSAPFVVRYAPPTAAGTLFDEIFDVGSGAQLIDASVDFSGDGLTYSVSGFGANIDPSTGMVTIQTDVTTDGVDVTVTASNSGGTIGSVFSVTVEPDTVVVEAYWTWLANTIMRTNETTQAAPGFLVNGNTGCLKIGGGYINNISPTFTQPVMAGNSITLTVALSATRTGGSDSVSRGVWCAFRDDSDNLIASGIPDSFIGRTETPLVSTDAETEVIDYNLTLVVPAGATKFFMEFQSDNYTNLYYRLYRLKIYDNTAGAGLYDESFNDTTIAGLLVTENSGPVFHAPYMYVGKQSQTLDYGSTFSDGYASIEFDGTIPRTIVGSEIYFTPVDEQALTTDHVMAILGSITPPSSNLLTFVDVAPAPLAASNPADLFIEINRPMPAIDPYFYVMGGVKPFSYSVVTKPSWITMEAHGTCFGRAPSAAVSATTVTIRVTDQAGATVDVSWDVTVVATRSRSGVALVAGGNIHDAIEANPGSNIVLDGGTYSRGGQEITSTGTAENPVIVVGNGSTIMVGDGQRRMPYGHIIWEDCHFKMTSYVEGTAAYSVDLRSISEGCMFFDCSFQGYEVTYFDNALLLSTKPSDPTVNDSAGALVDGNWYFNTTERQVREYQGGIWSNTGFLTSSFNTMWRGTGINIEGRQTVLDGCIFDGVERGVIVQGREDAVYNSLVQNMATDGMNVLNAKGGIVSDTTIRNHDKLFKKTGHRDLLQAYHENGRSKMYNRLTIQNCFFDCNGVYDVQGFHSDHDNWGGTSKLEEACASDIVLRNTVIIASSSNGFLFERFLRGIVDGLILIPHPDIPGDPICVHRRSSQIAFSNSFFDQITGDAHTGVQGNWSHLITQNNCESFGATGTAMTDVFPNYTNTGLIFDDPRTAVANGVAASTARFYINPDSAWGIANPLIGPGWLRTG